MKDMQFLTQQNLLLFNSKKMQWSSTMFEKRENTPPLDVSVSLTERVVLGFYLRVSISIALEVHP